MKVVEVHLAPGVGAFFYDDQAAIRAGAQQDGFLYSGGPLTEGFNAVRIPAHSLSIGLELSDGAIVWGDMMSVQYCGAGGRDPPLDAATLADLVRRRVRPRLLAISVDDFRSASRAVLSAEGAARLPLAIEYGTSQAILRASAHASQGTMAETICRAFGCPVLARPVSLYAQSGDARDINVDKMILKRVDILPHGLINSRGKFGSRGATFKEFARWVRNRVWSLGGADFKPTLHFDVYGWIGF